MQAQHTDQSASHIEQPSGPLVIASVPGASTDLKKGRQTRATTRSNQYTKSSQKMDGATSRQTNPTPVHSDSTNADRTESSLPKEIGAPQSSKVRPTNPHTTEAGIQVKGF